MWDGVRRIVYRHWPSFHGIRRLELATLRRFLQPHPGERILDLGSGKGALCGALARRGVAAFGIDPSMSALSIARRWVDPDGHFALAAGEDLPFEDARFDKAISVCVLEHTREDARVLGEARRVLKPGGVFALSVDCLNSPFVSPDFREHHVREYHCNQLYDDDRIRRLLDAAGFEVLDTEYLFGGRISVAILRWGSRFHYRGPFILLFPLLYPILWLDHLGDRPSRKGMILAVRAVARHAPRGDPAVLSS